MDIFNNTSSLISMFVQLTTC